MRTVLTNKETKREVVIVKRKDSDYDVYFNYLEEGYDSQCVLRKTYARENFANKKAQTFLKG